MERIFNYLFIGPLNNMLVLYVRNSLLRCEIAQHKKSIPNIINSFGIAYLLNNVLMSGAS